MDKTIGKTLFLPYAGHYHPALPTNQPAPPPGLSRENSSSSRPGSALSSTRAPAAGGVRLRPGSAGGRRQRPLSIATTGMTASMYEERQRPQGLTSTVHRSKGPGEAWCGFAQGALEDLSNFTIRFSKVDKGSSITTRKMLKQFQYGILLRTLMAYGHFHTGA